jgi:hypothetical protein
VDPERAPPTLLAVLAALGVLVAVVQTVRLALRGALARRALRQRCERAALGEERAAGLLARRGYEVVGRQTPGAWIVRVDGRDLRVDVRADYVVERAGRRFVAEVKTGRAAPHVESAATRRQLLEYRVAFDVDGVLLVDAESDAVREVEFPLPEAPAESRWSVGLAVALALAVGVVVGAALAEPLRAAAVAIADGARAP